MSQLLALYMGSLILRSIAIAAIAGIVSWKIRNVAVRHAVWIAVLSCMMLMPAVDYLLPASWVPAPIQQIASQQALPIHVASRTDAEVRVLTAQSTSDASVELPVRPNLNWWNVAAMLYFLVSLALFARFAMAFRKVWKLSRNAKVITSSVWEDTAASLLNQWRTPVLKESTAIQVPMTVGLIRPTVLLPTDWKTWDEWKLRAVLLHELAHVRRGDWGFAVVSAIARCAFWLNPLSWFLERKLAQLAEQASDDAALLTTQNSTRYAQLLLEFTITIQSGGRLMRGGIAMAQHNMKTRIERVLGNPISGTGHVRTAAWMLVVIIAAPLVYSASAVQVVPEPVVVPVAKYVAEFGRNPVIPAPVAVPQAVAPTVSPSALKVSQAAPADLRDLFQMEVESQKLQERYADLQEKLREAEQAKKWELGRTPEPQNLDRINTTLNFMQDETEKVGAELAKLQTVVQQQNQAMLLANDALLDLPDNKDDLLAYLKKLAELRKVPVTSYSVSFTGVQGRTVSMKVEAQSISFGCESCTFYVGESTVTANATTTAGPGMFVRLSPDGRDLYISCRASKCDVSENETLSDGTKKVLNSRQLETGVSELFHVSSNLQVVISKQ